MAFLPADILERLRTANRNGRLPHAMLLTGTSGTERARLAWEIAAMVNGIDPDRAPACPDIHTLEPESKSRRILVDPFHQFCGPFFSTSFRAGAVKTGIIFDADRLHPNAANAFLKTLEEPPRGCLFILAAPNAGLLPVTIVSRCAHFPLRSEAEAAPDETVLGVAQATGDVLSAPPGRRTGAALGLAKTLQSGLRVLREEVETELTSAFKQEKKRLGETADDQWIKDEEARLKALVEARVLAVRHRLAGVVAERVADVLRARHGSALALPSLEQESQQLAGSFDDAALLRILDGAARLRLFLDRNVKEDLALEAGCLCLARS